MPAARPSLTTPVMTKKTKLAAFAAVDGRSAVAIRYRKVLRSLRADLFGDGKINAAEIALLETAAMLITQMEIGRARILSGGEVDTDGLVRLANSAGRLLSALRTKSSAKNTPPSLAEYLAMTENANAETDDEEDRAEHS
jgi:hypothetical protein